MHFASTFSEMGLGLVCAGGDHPTHLDGFVRHAFLESGIC